VSLAVAARPEAAVVRRVRRLKAAVDRALIPGVVETHAGYRSLLVSYDPVAVNPENVREAVARLAEAEAALPPPPAPAASRPKRVPLCVCPACALDAGFIAHRLGVAWDEFVRRYCALTLEVWVTGFQPGSPLLGPVPDDLNLPRLDSPRTRVPAGSVGLGGFQTGIYAWPAPSGWRILGRTPAVLFDARRDPAGALKVGHRVAFAASTDHAALFPGVAGR
jgi:inhibitor of KinA